MLETKTYDWTFLASTLLLSYILAHGMFVNGQYVSQIIDIPEALTCYKDVLVLLYG